MDSVPPTTSAAPPHAGLPGFQMQPPAGAPQNNASLHMHQDSTAQDISSALHSIPYPFAHQNTSSHKQHDSQDTIIVHPSPADAVPAHRSGLSSVRMSTLGESSQPHTTSPQHAPHAAANPPATLAASAYANVAGTGLAGAQYASPPASLDSSAPAMSLASAGGGASMQEGAHAMPGSTGHTPQVSTVPPATSGSSSMFDSDTLPNAAPPSTRTESALGSVSGSPELSAQLQAPPQGLVASPKSPTGALAHTSSTPGAAGGGSTQHVFVPPGAADDSSEAPEESTHLDNPAAAPAPATHDGTSAPALSKDAFSRSNFLQPVDLPPPPEEPEYEKPSRLPPNVLTTQSIAQPQAAHPGVHSAAGWGPWQWHPWRPQ